MDNGWEKYQNLVLKELERLDESHKELIKKVDSLRIEVAVMKVKYGLIGGLCGAIPGIVAIILKFVKC